jgi:hypothetical protein
MRPIIPCSWREGNRHALARRDEMHGNMERRQDADQDAIGLTEFESGGHTLFGHGRDPLDEGRHGFHFTEPVGQADRIDLARDDQVFRFQEMAGLDRMEGGGARDARIEGHEHAIVPAGAHSGSPRVTTISKASLVMNRRRLTVKEEIRPPSIDLRTKDSEPRPASTRSFAPKTRRGLLRVGMVSNSIEVRNHASNYKDFHIFHGALERFGI